MSISILLAEKIAQLFLILLMGYLVVRVGLLKPEDSRVLSVIMVYLVMPCMILNAFQIDNTPEVRTGIGGRHHAPAVFGADGAAEKAAETGCN